MNLYTECFPDIYNQTPPTYTNLCPGEYRVNILDKICPFGKSSYVTIGGTKPNFPHLNISTKNTTKNICNGEAWVNVTGGTPPYTYQWFGAQNANSTTDYQNILCEEKVCVRVKDAENVWTFGIVSIGSDIPTTKPGDTLWTKTDTCLGNVSDAYVYSYKINTYTVDVRWALVKNGIVSYLSVSYPYTITLPGTYNVYLTSSCKSSNKLFATFTVGSVGIPDLKKDDIGLYPNPATDKLTLNLNNNVSSFTIMSVNGERIASYKVDALQMDVDVANLTGGVYFIQFTNTDGSGFVKKFVKM